MNKRILGLAFPSIISNITVPLLGLVDVSIVGHLGSAIYIGAIAVGGMLFSMIYWIFGFLRMGASGLTAQAYGRRDLAEVILLFVRSLGIAFGLALLLILLQYPILKVAFTLIDATPAIKELASLYFRICIWGAPAVLGLYSFAGWFVGMQNSRFPMYIAITQNVVNIAASLFFVFVWNRGVAGVAMGTLVAQYAGLLMASLLWYGYYRRLWQKLNWQMLTDYEAMRSFFILNRDIFFRTLCLVAVTTYFTSRGAEQGDIILAVNTLMMQLFTLYSYIMDGFAYAGEALTGRYVGAHNQADLTRMIQTLFAWGVGLALAFTLLYGIGGSSFLSLLTNEQEVLNASSDYFYWVLAIPLAGMAAFLWDGIYIGATASRQMLYSMLVASISFFILQGIFQQRMGNHALWMAFIAYLFLRGLVQTGLARKILLKSER
ncbi:MATE family efflux transporter [Parabacteroides sp. AGMB00274]|uniref:MATE family efflux transporter n=1 Tax=Parabacteroides faecalis TaxID=2924040 RepID=A0ABT0BW95_9BACT|nr:MATE family efflux transporter [Parabacteroides faecalis]MCI7286851.1 MATE family efflux transporter [Parabacteroides sp.]MCJ2379047.1 MATE family efflux transporter [Parabacteroides faecalis]MDD6950828.1 MATE family efflux transporter [Parabacteroides sp.]MDY6255939.1 MATE family efflux transporter [Bacteroidales bacterium]